MKKLLIVIGSMLIVFGSINTSCDKDPNDPNDNDTSFFVKDYEPDITIEKDDTVSFDINQDGKDDFKAFHTKSSGFTYLTFSSIDSNCFLSDGTKQPRKYLLKGDTINENLSWVDYITWVIAEGDSENGNAYLAIKIMSEQNINYGWLLPEVKGTNSSNHFLIIDKFVYYKIKDKEFIAGQEK